MRRDLCVALKTVDLVRETAWLALVEKLGWAGTLTGLERCTLWRFEGELASGADAEVAIAAELERSSAFYNPNKETYVFAPGQARNDGDLLSAAEALPVPAAPAGESWRAELWITDEGGARPNRLARSGPRLARDGIRLETLRSGTCWTLELRAGSRAEARGLLAGMALSRGRHEGLLFNQHYQEGHLLALEPLTEEARS